MKQVLRHILLSLALCATPFTASAQGIGIDVKNMPKGFEFHTLSSENEKRVYTFLGKVGRHYTFQVKVSRKGRTFIARDKYDAQGRRVEWLGNGNYRERWRPFDCEYTMGDCTHKRTDQYGQGRKWIYSTKKISGSLLTLRRHGGEERWRIPTTVELGDYNIRMYKEVSKGGDVRWWRKVTKIVK